MGLLLASRFPDASPVAAFHHAWTRTHRYGSSRFPPVFHGEDTLSGFRFSTGSCRLGRSSSPASATPISYWRPRLLLHPRTTDPAEDSDTDPAPGVFGGPAVKSATTSTSGHTRPAPTLFHRHSQAVGDVTEIVAQEHFLHTFLQIPFRQHTSRDVQHHIHLCATRSASSAGHPRHPDPLPEQRMRCSQVPAVQRVHHRHTGELHGRRLLHVLVDRQQGQIPV